MKRRIIGVTVGSPLPKPNLMQTDPTKGDYVKGKEEFLEQFVPESGGNVSPECGLTPTVKTALLTILDSVSIEESKQTVAAEALETLRQLWFGGEVRVYQSGTTLVFENVTGVTNINQNGTLLTLT